jgi:LPS export ABC transporter protein LptC
MHSILKNIVVLIVVVLSLASSGCGSKKEKIPVSQTPIQSPYQEFDHSTLNFYNGSRKVWQLDAQYMRKGLDKTGAATVIPVRLSFFDSTGRSGTRILADTGATNGAMEHFTIWGNVYVKTDDGQIIESQSLTWSQNAHTFTSNELVRITTPNGDVLQGRGLDANEDFSRWSLRQNVTGKFPQFKKRVESDESFLN